MRGPVQVKELIFETKPTDSTSFSTDRSSSRVDGSSFFRGSVRRSDRMTSFFFFSEDPVSALEVCCRRGEPATYIDIFDPAFDSSFSGQMTDAEEAG